MILNQIKHHFLLKLELNPETVPEGKPATICADDDTVPEGTDVDPESIPVPPKLDIV